MSTNDHKFGRLKPHIDSEITREVYDALNTIALPPSARSSARADEPTLFDLVDCLRRLDIIDAAKRAADADKCNEVARSWPHQNASPSDEEPPQSVYHLSPARFEGLRQLVIRAYAEVRNGSSADRLVADEMLNDEFLRRCWELGAMASAYELNWCLLNARKAGVLHVGGSTHRFAIPANRLNEFTFATEYSIRYIQNEQARSNGREVSLDRILCDPLLAKDFDEIAKRIAPGYSSLEYRWAAFTIRKARRPYMSPFSVGFEAFGDTRSVRASQLPTEGGVYRFVCDSREMYIGETDNLRRQIGIHFDNNGVSVFPDWLMPGPRTTVELMISPLPSATSMAERSRAKTFFTDRFAPQLNWLGKHKEVA